MAQNRDAETSSPPFVQTTASAVLGVNSPLHHNGTMLNQEQTVANYTPQQTEIADLINRAEAHPAGLDFLREGMLDAVAATFSVHAFVVDQARASLASNPAATSSKV